MWPAELLRLRADELWARNECGCIYQVERAERGTSGGCALGVVGHLASGVHEILEGIGNRLGAIQKGHVASVGCCG